MKYEQIPNFEISTPLLDSEEEEDFLEINMTTRNVIEIGGDNDRERDSSRESKRWIKSTVCTAESLNFDEAESVMWRKHQLRRFFQGRGNFWTPGKKTTAWKWFLVILIGTFVAFMGIGVSLFTTYLLDLKFKKMNDFLQNESSYRAYLSILGFSCMYAMAAAILCWKCPQAAGGGIAEVKAYLNGVNLNKAVRIEVLFTKVIGVCFSCAAGLPLGKEGPMIHCGSIVGAAVSQGRSVAFKYFDTSWTKFQDLRNDRSKRDFITYGAAAGVASAFSAPIGGIMFTLEEGASFWSTSLTFRAFFCALVTQLVLNLFNSYRFNRKGTIINETMFEFGDFSTFPGYYPYELVIFMFMGAAGGVMGALFVHINEKVTVWRMGNLNTVLKKILELLFLTFSYTSISFLLPLINTTCTPIPTNTATWSDYEYGLLSRLEKFNCPHNSYNQFASLFLTDSATVLEELFHFPEDSSDESFSSAVLLVFFVVYFLFAAYTSGTFAPAGLFIPTLVAGAAFGRIIGHLVNIAHPGSFSAPGIYALIGASAILGGMSRMTIAGTVIILEASGNSEFLLPLMLTFASSRYSGNAINDPMYDMLIRLKELPFLTDSLKALGLLNYHPITEIMSKDPVTISELNRVSSIYDVLNSTSHHGFPVVDKKGRLQGFILRNTLCSLLQLKAFSTITKKADGQGMTLISGATVFYDTMERNYPKYPKISDIKLTSSELKLWLDVRPYMDTSPSFMHESSSIQRAYRFFRTMGLRHLLIIDDHHRLQGIVSRQDLTEHRLEHHWFEDGHNMQKFLKFEGGNICDLTDDDLSEYDLNSPLSPLNSNSRLQLYNENINNDMIISNPFDSDDETSFHTRNKTISSIMNNDSINSSNIAFVPPNVTNSRKEDKEPKSFKSER